MHFTLALAALSAAALPLVSAHGFIKDVTVNGQTSRAQKTDIKQSSFRAVSDNTGWIGSNFLASDCSVCGCSNTPFGRVATPDGTVFANAGQSAGQTPQVAAGSKVTLHVAGNPGQGWPHPNGHMQAYLGSCGDSCANFDAKTADFFKIQGIKDGIPALRAAFDKGSDSNPWDIEIPKNVKSGKYILRSEIWAYGQSAEVEGKQVQFYPFCMNVEVTNGGSANPDTVKFPGTYADQRQQIVSQGLSLLPGPQINQAFGGSGTGVGSSNKGSTGAGNTTTSGTGNTGSGSNSGSSSSGSNSGSGSSSSGTKKTSKKTSKKCKAPKKHSTRRRHHERNAARAAHNHES